ncbi:MAG: hypothetical protein KH035_04620 [Collinsella sp.]|nr:hypothetical protein [Collinsella sp.]
MREKKMGMRTVLTRILGIATVACALVATPAVASAETQVPANTQVLSLGQAGKEPVKITEPGCYVLRTSENQTTPSSGYVIDVPNATSYNPVTIYIDGTVYVNDRTNALVGQERWLFNIKQGSNIEFIGINNPCVSFHDKSEVRQSVSGFLTDRYYDGGYKNASGDISVSLGIGDDSQDLTLWYSSSMEQKVPAISLGNTKGNLSANFSKLMIKDYAGKSGAVAGNAQEYAVPVHLFREGRNTTGGNINPFTATFTDCEFYDTSGDFNGAVSVDGNSSFKMPKDGSAVAKLTATFNNCSFSGHNGGGNGENLGVRQTNKSYKSVEASRYFANSSILNTYAVAGVMGVTNATVNLNSCTMNNFHSTRSSSADNTLTVDALNVARSARCNINGGTIERYGARGNTCMVYAAGSLTLDGKPKIGSFHKNASAGDTNQGDGYTDADVATGTAKSIYVPKKKNADDSVPAINLASGFSAPSSDNQVLVTVAEVEGNDPFSSRFLGKCDSSNSIKWVKADGPSGFGAYTDDYQIVNLNGDLTFRKAVHECVWQIDSDSVTGLYIEAKCVGSYNSDACPYRKKLTASYTLAMSTKGQTGLVYDGEPIQLSMDEYQQDNLAMMGVTVADVTWYRCKTKKEAEAFKSGTKLESAPKDAGYYYLVVSYKTSSGFPNYGKTLEGKTAFEIVPRDLKKNKGGFEFILRDGGKYTYDEKEHRPIIASATFTNGAGKEIELVEGADFELSGDLVKTDPGEYECYVNGKGNYAKSFKLSWKIVDVARFDLEVAGFDGTYDGKEHGITVNVKNDPQPADMKIEYREDGGDWTTDKPTYRNAAEYTTHYRVKASDYLTVTGKATVKISKANQDAPTGLVGNNWTTCSSKDGSILGVTKAMEYRRGSSGDYQKITSDGKLTELTKSGTYYVRYAEDNNHNASADAEVKIEPGPHAVADNAAWQPGDGSHYKACKYCKRAQVWQSCRWNYKIITPATPEADGVRQKVCRVCGYEWFEKEPYTYVDTYAPTIYDLWEDNTYCESVTFDVIDDRDETVTVTDNGEALRAGKDGRYTVKAAEGDAGAEHVIVATDAAGNAESRKIKMNVEHAYEWTIDKQPTVSEAGSKHGKCSVCGHESGSVEVPALGIKGYSGTYDGEWHGVTVDTNTVASIQYRMKGDTLWLETTPSIRDAGTKTFEFKAKLVSGESCKGEVELKVDPCPVTVKPKDASKVYGYDDPNFKLEAVEGTIPNGESLSWLKIHREPGENVGTYKLTIEQREPLNTVDKIRQGNYELTLLQTGTFEITKRQIGVGWTVGTYTYNGKPQGPKVTVSNVAEGDEGKVSYEVENATGIDAGSYPAKVTGLAGDPEVIKNYALPTENLEYTYTIYKAEQEKPQGLKATAETIRGKCDGKIEGARGGVAYRLFRTEAGDADGETMVSEDGKIENLAAGDYQVWYAETNNYMPSTPVEVHVGKGKYLNVTLSEKNDAYSIVWYSPNRLQWHESVEFSVKISDGYYAGDDFAVKANGVVLEKNEGGRFVLSDVEENTAITVEGVRKHEAVNDKWLSNDNTHWHECTCGEKIDEATHTFEWVVDKTPTATEAGSKHQQCTVCGHALPAVEIPLAAIVGYSGEYDGAYHTVDATRLPEGATAQYSADGKNWSPEAPKIKDVGTLTVSYKVTIDGVKAEGEVTLEVKPRAITVTAQDDSKTYGEADPVFTWDVTSGKLVAGETLQGLEIEREDDDNVREGGYALQLTQPEGANPNYSITFVDGMFTINQRLLTVTWGTTEFTYDGNEHCPVATLGNVIGNDDLGATVEGSQTEVGTSYKATLAELTGKAAGNYVLPSDGLTCEFSIKNAAQDAPVVQATAETVSGKKDGKITGVDATMEWRAQGAEYQTVGKGVTELKDLAAGVCEVRYQAKANYDASAVTEVTVKAGRKLVVGLPTTQEGYSLTSTATELDWHGSAKLAMSIDSAYFAGKDYTVKVDGKAVKLSDAGTFELKDVEHDVNVTVEGVLKHEPDGSGWAHDAKNHWHVCRCGEVLDKAEHTFEWVVDTPATTETKGKKHQECTVCREKGKSEEIAILAPEIIDGKGQTMVVDAAKDLSFRSSAPIEFFQKVLVDDREVAAENYVLTEGSTIVTLKASFLKTLGVGEHKLSVVSATGTAETTFTVAEAAKPAPGQTTTTTTTTTTTSKPKKKAGKETLPQSGDSAYAMAGAVLAAGVAALLLAWAMKRRA